jgi:hypothetical protein
MAKHGCNQQAHMFCFAREIEVFWGAHSIGPTVPLQTGFSSRSNCVDRLKKIQSKGEK